MDGTKVYFVMKKLVHVLQLLSLDLIHLNIEININEIVHVQFSLMPPWDYSYDVFQKS